METNRDQSIPSNLSLIYKILHCSENIWLQVLADHDLYNSSAKFIITFYIIITKLTTITLLNYSKLRNN